MLFARFRPSIHRITEKGSSRKLGFRSMAFPETKFPALEVLGNSGHKKSRGFFTPRLFLHASYTVSTMLGLMFWLRRNKFVGSYLFFRATNLSRVLTA